MGPLLNVKEAAEFLNVKESTVYRLSRNGTLPHFRVGRSVRFSKERLENYLANPTVVVEPEPQMARPTVARL